MNSLKQAPRVNIVTNLLQEKKRKAILGTKVIEIFPWVSGEEQGYINHLLPTTSLFLLMLTSELERLPHLQVKLNS